MLRIVKHLEHKANKQLISICRLARSSRIGLRQSNKVWDLIRSLNFNVLGISMYLVGLDFGMIEFDVLYYYYYQN